MFQGVPQKAAIQLDDWRGSEAYISIKKIVKGVYIEFYILKNN